MTDTAPNTNDFFRKLADYATDIITIMNGEGHIIFNNPAVTDAFGYEPASMIGKKVSEYIHPDDIVHVGEAIGKVVTGAVAIEESEFRFRHVDGSYRHMHAVGRLFEHEGMTGLLVNSRDITNQHKVIQNLARTNELLSKTFDASNTYLSISRQDNGVVMDVNNAWCKAMGYTREEVIGNRRLPSEVWGSAENRQRMITKLADKGEISGYETYLYPKNGPRLLVLVDMRMIEVGDEVQILTSSADITESRRIEEELRQSQKMEAIGQLTGGVAHDFNNLIGITMGNAELLLHQLPADSTNRQHAQQILDASKRAADLTRQLLAFSRRQPLQSEPTDLREELEKMTPLLQTTLSENTDVIIQSDTRVGLCSVDKAQFESALLNLVLNARDAMPTGGKVKFTLTNVNRDGTDYVQLEVSDNGSGMSSETRQHAFEPFFTTKEQGKGTGLGLSMVFGFVNQSGGHVHLQSNEPDGTTVTLLFPEVRQTTTTKPVTASDQPEPQTDARWRALVVEDNQPLRILVAQYLVTLGYQVSEAYSEKSALAALEENRELDLLVSDILLSGPTTGVQLAKTLRGRYPNLQVILMTGYAAQEPTEVADALLQKPFSRDHFVDTVRMLTAPSSQNSAG